MRLFRRPFLPLVLLCAWVASAPCAADEFETPTGVGPAMRNLLGQATWQLRLQAEEQPASTRKPPKPDVPLRFALGPDLELRADGVGLTLQSSETPPAAAPTMAPPSEPDLSPTVRMQASDAGIVPGAPWLWGASAATTPAAGPHALARPWTRLSAEWALPSEVRLRVMPGLLVDREGDGRHHGAGILAVALGKNFAPQWQGTLAMVGRSGNAAGNPPLSLDSGVAYRASDRLRVDFALSHGLAGGAASLQGGVGVSARF